MAGAQGEVLIVGNGGREYEIGRCLEPFVDRIYFARGNAGTESFEKGENLPIGPTEIGKIGDFAVSTQVDLVVVGPDEPLSLGIVDSLKEKEVPVFGPTQEAARLEWSKVRGMEFAKQWGLVHAPSVAAYNREQAMSALAPDVTKKIIKADGLAGGKGAMPPKSMSQAYEIVCGMFDGRLCNGAGKDALVIQDRIPGPELSAMAITDGDKFVMLPYAQDHKKLNNYDRGPMTGGMGAYSPVPEAIVSYEQDQKIHNMVERLLFGMRAEGKRFSGEVFLGLILNEENDGEPTLIEINARPGDPETQVQFPLMESAGVHILDLMSSVAHGKLEEQTMPTAETSQWSALTVCLADKHYPDPEPSKAAIRGLVNDYSEDELLVQIANARIDRDRVIAVGGRVLYLTGVGENIDEAACNAYDPIDHGQIGFSGMQYRDDIGWQVRSDFERYRTEIGWQSRVAT